MIRCGFEVGSFVCIVRFPRSWNLTVGFVVSCRSLLVARGRSRSLEVARGLKMVTPITDSARWTQRWTQKSSNVLANSLILRWTEKPDPQNSLNVLANLLIFNSFCLNF